MGERIYRRGDGGLTPLKEERFPSEGDLQALIAGNPELLDGDEPRRWILVRREQGIADADEAAERWAADVLLVDQNAVPTFVEVKRGSNSELRRRVVGQMLDYAAHAPHLRVDDLREAFEQSARDGDDDPDAMLAELLEDEGEADADEFWNRVAANLRAGRLRLLFAADRIPDELARIVGFLNAQMPNVEVLAVEIRQFRAGESQTLIPTVIGRTVASPTKSGGGSRTKLTEESFLARLEQDAGMGAREAAARLLGVAAQSGARIEWGTGSVSIRCANPLWNKEPGPRLISLAWIFPPGRSWFTVKGFSFGATLAWWPNLPDRLRTLLAEWGEQFADIGEAAGHNDRDRVYAVSYDDAAAHIDTLAERLERVLAGLRAL